MGNAPEPIVLTSGNEEQTCFKIADWIRARNAAVDITPGTKEMSAILLVAARRCRAEVAYLRHQIIKNTNSQEYGTEQFETLP